MFYYRCDKVFHLDELIKLYEKHDYYAIVLVSGKIVELYIHSNVNTKLIRKIEMSLPNQHKTGGQSAQRFERIRNEKIGWFIKKIMECMINSFVDHGQFKYKGLIVAGPGELKNTISDNDLFIKYFAKHLLKILTISEIKSQTINDVIGKSIDVFEHQDLDIFRKLEKQILDPNGTDLIVFGDEAHTLFIDGKLKELYVSGNYDQIDLILHTKNKTQIFQMKQKVFESKYGMLVGVKYYADRFDENENVIEV